MALTSADIKVDAVVEDTIEDEQRGTLPAVRVYYTIAEHGPYSILIPKTELSAARVLIDVRQDAQRYIEILNVTF